MFRKRWRTCKLSRRAVIRNVSLVCVYCLQANKWYPTTTDLIWTARQWDCLVPSASVHVYSVSPSSYWHWCTKWQGRKGNAPGSGVFCLALVYLTARTVVRLRTLHSVTGWLAYELRRTRAEAAADLCIVLLQHLSTETWKNNIKVQSSVHFLPDKRWSRDKV